MALSVGLALPAKAMTTEALLQLNDDIALLEARTASIGFSASASAAPQSLKSGMLSLELDLQFPAIGSSTSMAASKGDYNSYTMAVRAWTARSTVVLRACTIAEEAAPPAGRGGASYASLAQRVNAIQNALQLEAPYHRPSRSQLGFSRIAQAVVDAEEMMAILGDYLPMDSSVDASTWYYHSLLTIMWQNAKDVCDLYSTSGN
jgi:hypothetical protein